MDKIKINLNKIVDIKKFYGIVNSFKSDIDICTRSVVLDAKSLLALYSIDLSNDVYVCIHTKDNEENNKFKKEMEAFR